MKNYNIIYNGAIINTIKASFFTFGNDGQILFFDKEQDKVFAVYPKEYAVIETKEQTLLEAICSSLVSIISSPNFNDIERKLPNFEDYKKWITERDAKLIDYINEITKP